MRKTTLKLRIVVWYTLWIIILLSFQLLIVGFSAEYLFEKRIKERVAEQLKEAIEDIEYKKGAVDFSDVDFFEDGVFISIYDEDGNLLSGRDMLPWSRYPYAQRNIRKAGNWFYLDQEHLGYYVRAASEAGSLSALYSGESLFILILLPIVTVIVVAGGYLIVSRSLKPLEEVTRAASGISDGNDLSKRIGQTNSAKEIAELSKTIDAMLERLETSFKSEKQFISDASHELRTPVSVIRAESEYAESNMDNKEEVMHSLSVIKQESNRMASLISQLLSMARYETGRSQMSKTKLDLSAMAQMTAEVMEREAEQKRIKIISKIEEGVFIDGDETLITRLMINLISNAIAYGKENGHILIRLEKEASFAHLEVEDDGIGIDEEDLLKIWDRFYQADNSRHSEGLGLGLSMARWIVNVHDGNIECKSQKGVGTTFIVTLSLYK